MTIQDRLIKEVQHLTESEAAAVLEFLKQQKNTSARPAWPPSFAGVGRSGAPDLGARSEELLRAELGSQ